jgi:pimeloyl-ACP methyl ester carboxylesterase
MSPTLATHEWSPSRVDAIEAADAPVAVLVHGLKGWHRTWWRLGPALAQHGWRVVAVDQLGHGSSPRITGAASIDDFAGALEATIEAVADTPVDLLLGHSLGAAVAMWLAQRRPDVARRLVLEDPPSVDRTADAAFLDAIVTDVESARRNPAAEIERELAEHPRWLPEDAQQDVEGRAKADAPGLVASLRIPRPFDVAEIAPRLPMPALWILAEEGGSVLTGDARRRLRETLPATGTIVELDSGHTCHRDRFDEYLATLLGWLDRE